MSLRDISGHATAYKLGERQIRKLREKLESEEKLDLKKFHRNVLECLGPLDFLEECVRESMMAQQLPVENTLPTSGSGIMSTSQFLTVFLLPIMFYISLYSPLTCVA